MTDQACRSHKRYPIAGSRHQFCKFRVRSAPDRHGTGLGSPSERSTFFINEQKKSAMDTGFRFGQVDCKPVVRLMDAAGQAPVSGSVPDDHDIPDELHVLFFQRESCKVSDQAAGLGKIEGLLRLERQQNRQGCDRQRVIYEHAQRFPCPVSSRTENCHGAILRSVNALTQDGHNCFQAAACSHPVMDSLGVRASRVTIETACT